MGNIRAIDSEQRKLLESYEVVNLFYGLALHMR